MNSTKQKFLIAPFKEQVRMNSKQAETNWEILKEAMHDIFRQNLSGIGNSWEELYRKAYNMALHKYGDMMYSGLKQTVEEHLKTVAEDIAEANDETFLAELNQKWREHKISMVMIRDIFMYMDRTHVIACKKLSVLDLGTHLFLDHVVRSPTIKGRLLSTVLDQIHKDRCSLSIDRVVLKDISEMLMELGKDVYVDDFETPFLAESARFYQDQHIGTDNCLEYLKTVDSMMAEEESRVTQYLDHLTVPKIKEVMQQALVTNHRDRLLTSLAEEELRPARDAE
mmetsp:Transcript_14669/g.25063  ORF Transcript_14669/g.25063 Transcript_14669/m.25063 type:complete len:282 (+) Transcript_14669:110-955(+)